MEQYKETAKKLISQLYVQGNICDYDVALSTSMVLADLQCLLPANSIDEFDVYNVLSELYQPYYTSSVELKEVSNDKGEKELKEEGREGVKYLWYLKRI